MGRGGERVLGVEIDVGRVAVVVEAGLFVELFHGGWGLEVEEGFRFVSLIIKLEL